jgi:hypothetical protein|tara:strand:+ start:210 stop:407 length:198 start_codon:yes stop_codon:yes gene_type:complete
VVAAVDHKVEVVVLEHIKPELHQSEHTQYRQPSKLVLVETVVKGLLILLETLLELLELHLTLEHQ